VGGNWRYLGAVALKFGSARPPAALPLKRATAARKLKELLARVATVNRDPHYLYRVQRVVLFGSMLSTQETVSDIDVAVELQPKHANPEEYLAAIRARVEETIRRLDSMSWLRGEIGWSLQSRSRDLSLHSTDGPVLEQCESCVIYEYQGPDHEV
jgi:predicted nucleotidyltransferase